MFKKLLLLFIVVPLVELMIFIQLSEVVSLSFTLCVIIITGALGAYLTKQQGRLALRNLQGALGQGKMPHVEASDGILILIAGAVLITPGFLTDGVGFALLIPSVRSQLRGRLGSYLKNAIKVQSFSSQSYSSTATHGEESMKAAKGRVINED